MQKTADVLNHLRLKKGLTQEELAEKLCISASYLSLLERGKRPATKRVLRCLADYLKVPAGYFVLQNMKLADLSARHQALVKEIRRELIEPAFERAFARTGKPKARKKPGRPAGTKSKAKVSGSLASHQEIPGPQLPSTEVASPGIPAPEIARPNLPGPELLGPSLPDIPTAEEEHAGLGGEALDGEGQSR